MLAILFATNYSPLAMKHFISVLLLLILVCCGCVSLDSVNSNLAKVKYKLTPPGPPTQLVAVWDQAVKTEGNKVQRGFAGRVYFYPSNNRKPVKCDGDVVVYAFDETNRAVGDNRPTRSYVFSHADLQKHCYSKSSLGHSYSVWIPWDSAGPEGEAREISIIVKSVPETGSSVVSSQAKVHLPGKMSEQKTMLAEERVRTITPSPVYASVIERGGRAAAMETYTVTQSSQGTIASRSAPAAPPALTAEAAPMYAAPAMNSPYLVASPHPMSHQTTPSQYR